MNETEVGAQTGNGEASEQNKEAGCGEERISAMVSAVDGIADAKKKDDTEEDSCSTKRDMRRAFCGGAKKREEVQKIEMEKYREDRLTWNTLRGLVIVMKEIDSSQQAGHARPNDRQSPTLLVQQDE